MIPVHAFALVMFVFATVLTVIVVSLVITIGKLAQARTIALDALDQAESALTFPIVRAECNAARRAVREAIAELSAQANGDGCGGQAIQ